MNDTFKIMLFASAGGFPIVVGGLISSLLQAKRFKLKSGMNHWIIASGEILYLIFQDIAPLSKERKNWIPATGASFGFILGLIGQHLIN